MLEEAPLSTKESDFVSAVKHDSKYDIVKFILSLLVLAIHSGIYPMVLYPWLRIAVPLFFMMSSYFLFTKLQGTAKDHHKSIVRKFILRNIQLYLCWFIILLPITLYIRRNTYFSNGLFENAFVILKSILFGSTFVASWFIPATIWAVLIIIKLDRILKNNFILLLFSVTVFSFVTLASSYESVIHDTIIAVAIEKYIDVFDILVCSFPAAIFWVFMGKLFAEQKLRLRSLLLLFILTGVSCAALFVEWKFVFSLDNSYNNDSYFMLAPLCVLLFMCIDRIKSFYWEKSVYLKRMSTVIYVTHASLLPVLSKLLSIILGRNIPLISYILTLIGCIIIYALIEVAIKKTNKPPINKILKMLY